MKINIIINATDKWQASCAHALELCRCVVTTGHELGQVFFFGHAVKIINSPDDMKQWQNWQENNTCELLFCSTMLTQFGINCDESAMIGISVVGLGSWVDGLEQADKTIELN